MQEGDCDRRQLGDQHVGAGALVEEDIWLRVAPTAAVRRARAAVRVGIAAVWGSARVPGPAGGFAPHLSLAYSDSDGPEEPYAAALAGMPPRSARVTVAAVQLIDLVRYERLYRWEAVATVPLGLRVGT